MAENIHSGHWNFSTNKSSPSEIKIWKSAKTGTTVHFVSQQWQNEWKSEFRVRKALVSSEVKPIIFRLSHTANSSLGILVCHELDDKGAAVACYYKERNYAKCWCSWQDSSVVVCTQQDHVSCMYQDCLWLGLPLTNYQESHCGFYYFVPGF